MRLEGKSLKGDFLRFIIPSILAQLVYTLYTMVDGMFVAVGVSEIALTAVNLVNPFIQTMFALALMLAVGSSTVIAILLGRKREREASQAFTQNVAVLLVLSAAIAAGVMAAREPFARFLGAPDQLTLGYMVEYLSWIAPFAPAFLLVYTLEILMKTDGFPRRVIVIVTVGAVENCVLDWLFVMVLNKGVAGAAFATSISQVTVVLFYLAHFLSGRGTLRFTSFRFSLPLALRSVRNGFSSGLTELSAGVVTFAFNHAILAVLDQDALVSYTIVSYVNSIIVLSATGIAQGSQPLISYYYGKGNMASCKKLLRYCVTAATAFCMGAFVLCFLLAPGIVGIYVGPELEALRLSCVQAFRVFIVSFLPVGFNIAVSGYFIAVEQPAPALAISAGRGFVFLLLSLALLASLCGPMIWWAPALSEALCLAVTLCLLLRYCRRDPRWNGA